MGPFRTPDEFYAAMDALIAELEGIGRTRLSRRLDVMMHEVAWTTGSEMMDELGKELSRATGEPEHAQLPVEIRNRIDQILKAADGPLGSDKERRKRLDEYYVSKEAEEKRNEARVKAERKRKGLI